MQEDIKSILPAFLEQVETTSHITSQYPDSYSGLKLEVGFGIGRSTKIPWIAFLAEHQTVRNGIFPVFYFFKQHNKLVLAYGISEATRPMRSWLAPSKAKTIKSYFQEIHIKPQKYHDSYVHTVYSTFGKLDLNKIETDLDRLIDHYKKVMQAK